MPRERHRRHVGVPARRAHPTARPPSPGTVDGRTVVGLADDELRQLGLPPGSIVTVDRTRRPANGDLVWVELVRYGSTKRLIRRYALDAGWVTLSLPDDSAPAIMRRHGEVLVLGVAEVDRGADPPPAPASS